MDLEQIEKLVEIIEKSTLKEITVEEGNLKINLKRENNIEIQSISKNIEKKVEIVEEPDEESFITLPIVGTFYSAASPETPAFVRVGDTVKKGKIQPRKRGKVALRRYRSHLLARPSPTGRQR